MRHAPGPDASTDEAIIRRVQAGEAKLFSVIFERHYRRLERFVRHLGVTESDLEDVLAEVFARAFARVGSFNAASGTRYSTYLYAIARNLVTDRLRASGRAPAMLVLEETLLEADTRVESPLEALLRREQVERIRAALPRLNPSDREIIILSYDRELTCREIMEVMGKPSVTAVTTHLYKAVKRLRELVLAPDSCGTAA